MAKHEQTANRVVVEAGPRLTPTGAAVLASAASGAAVSVDVVRRALREGKLKGRFKDGKWDAQIVDVLAWAEKRRKA